MDISIEGVVESVELSWIIRVSVLDRGYTDAVESPVDGLAHSTSNISRCTTEDAGKDSGGLK